MKIALTLDSIALLLYCSELHYSEDEPFSMKEWDYLEKKIKKSQLKRPAGLIGLSKEQIALQLDVNSEIVDKLAKMNSKLADLMVQLAKLESLGIGITTKFEEDYPTLLKMKLKKNSPLILYYMGNYELLNTSMIYVTGPIKTNSTMITNAKKITDKLHDEGYSLITSNSRGVENHALTTQLKDGGKAILFSCENLLTAKKQFSKPVKNGQMLLISARHPFATFDLVGAIDRNQYIYCLSALGIVVYSSINTGATWLSAIQNINYKYTKLGAIVDDEFYGNARLIELGAFPITMDMIDSEMTLEEMSEDPKEDQIDPILYDQLSIYDFLG